MALSTTSDIDHDVLLADGGTARIRTVRPDDADAIAVLYAGMSPKNVVRRFFSPHKLTSAELDRMVHLDSPDALGLVAIRDGAIVAMAEYTRLAEHEDAEVAFAVTDAFQGRGLGTLLLEHLAAAARPHGIKRFVADTLSDNYLMLSVFRDAGFEELFDAAELLTHQPVPAGDRVAIVGNAGGPGVLAADACIGFGLEVPELSRDLQERLRAFLPSDAGVRNPIDMVASATADSYRRALALVLSSNDIDAAIVIFTPPLVTRANDVADAVLEAVGASDGTKPVAAAFLGADAREILHAGDPPVACYTYPESAARALAHARQYTRWRDRARGTIPIFEGADANEARRLLAPDELSEPDG